MCLGGSNQPRHPGPINRSTPASGTRPADEKTGPAGKTGIIEFDVHHPDNAGKGRKSSYEQLHDQQTSQPTNLGEKPTVNYPGSDTPINF